MSMSWLLTNSVAAFLLPPLNGLLPAFLGMAVLKRRPRLGRSLIALGLAILTALSLPVVATALMRALEDQYPPLPQAAIRDLSVDAIVILGAGSYRRAPEFSGEDDLKGLALERLRYGALIARASGKPVLVAGGNPDGEGKPEGEIMKGVLARDFGIMARWTEERSDNTRENGLYSAQILLPQGIRRIALVTHAYHMPRSVLAFEAAGFEVLPAPTAFFEKKAPVGLLDFVPNYGVMRVSGLALHEMIGLIWYRLRG